MDMPRAATTHAATLEMLAGLGMVDEVIERGLVEPLFRIWDRGSRTIVAEFDFGRLKDETPYPFAVQCEQHKLAAMAIARLRDLSACQDRVLGACHGAVAIRRRRGDRGRIRRGVRKVAGSYLIGCDGGRSTVRKALGIEFEGYTHPERFLILTTSFDIGTMFPGCTRNYLSDPDDWFSLFKVSGDGDGPLWRVLSATKPEQTEAELMNPEATEATATAVPAQGQPLSDRPPQSLQRASARRGELPQGPRVPGRRRLPRQQSARRPRPQLRHPRCDRAERRCSAG